MNEVNTQRNKAAPQRRGKKVAIFHCGFIYSGGGERIVIEEALGLKKRGFEVIVRTPTLNPTRCYPDLLPNIDAQTLLPPLLPNFSYKYALQMVATSVLAPLLAFQYRDTDVFIGANQPGAWLAYCMAKVLNKPYLVYLNQPNRLLYPREVDRENGWVTETSYEFLAKVIHFLRPVIKIIDDLSFGQANVKLVNGSYIAGLVESIYQFKTVNCPAGAHPQAEIKLAKEGTAFHGQCHIGKFALNKPYILLTNRHDPQKKFEYAIEAMKLVKTRYPKVKLIIPGPFTRHTPQLLALVRKRRLSAHVLFLGQISESDLQRLYQHAAVYIYTAPQEDFGIGPLEAGAWAVPTVA